MSQQRSDHRPIDKMNDAKSLIESRDDPCPQMRMRQAIEERHIEAIKLLAETDKALFELLLTNEDESIVAQLIESGFVPANSLRVSMFAAANNNDKIIALLIDAGFVSTSTVERWLPIYAAAVFGNERVLARLFAHLGIAVPDAVDYEGIPTCHYVARNRNTAVMAWLIAAGCDVNITDRVASDAPIHIAASHNNVGVVRLLIDVKAHLNVRNALGQTPLLIAALKGNESIFDLLVTAGGVSTNVEHTDNNGMSLCHATALSKNETLLNKVIALGCDLNARNKSGETPCDVAAMKSNVNCLRAVIAAGGSIGDWSNKGFQLVHLAAANADVRVLEFVLSLGGNVDARVHTQLSPCHVAAEHGLVDNVLALVDAGARLDALDYYGNSILYFAARAEENSRGRSLVRVLLQLGADPLLTNDRGEFPVHVASGEGLAVLFSWGVDIGRATCYWNVRKSASIPATVFAAGAASVDNSSLRAEVLDSAIAMISEREWLLFQLRAHVVCIGLQSLRLPALVTCEILSFMFSPRESTVAFHRMWAVATLVKHF